MAKKMKKQLKSEMIKKDMSAQANLPQQVIMKEYSKNEYLYSHELGDSVRGIDRQINEDIRGANRNGKMEKY